MCTGKFLFLLSLSLLFSGVVVAFAWIRLLLLLWLFGRVAPNMHSISKLKTSKLKFVIIKQDISIVYLF